ncbi:pyrroline-5-carboxylate reductase [Defluviicoccus vanus]|uniref:Pyrroline-5-carboxylate reductase n=1 Tax=Defluviicoccus vanus TaxID=111831 RepID=A0A7H1N3G6_9PROT|nr:pyrroline-5-carboxylate reductase [Defluviicoccus vanus]QNT70252.1 pyrroline-5-carboxylate reductase [Defluviicoccus vanus]
MLSTARIVLVGCGHMGNALLTGWLAASVAADRVTIIEPDTSKAAGLVALAPITVVQRPDGLSLADVDVVVLAVKPQVLDEVAPAYLPFAAAGAVLLSIAAGRTLASLAGALGDAAAIVRAMPNTPAAVGRGMTAACATATVSAAQRGLVDALLSAVGEVVWLDDESLIDAVTAVSGSGPAYVFYLAECLAEAGVAAGLPPSLARQMARATITGAGELMFRAAEPADELRRRVTSPGGTTAAALTALMAQDGLQPLLTEAVRRAAARSRELSH